LIEDEDNQKPGLVISSVVMWVIGAVLVYARWFEHRQGASEQRRGYRFYVRDNEYDLEVAHAKESLLSTESTEDERQQALDLLLSRGACSPPGQPAPSPSPY
jgi:hypothetical protein